MSSFSEDDIRRAAEVREWLMKEVTNKKEELDKLRQTLFIVDSILKKVSFVTASNLESSAANSKEKIVPEFQSVNEKRITNTEHGSNPARKLTSTDNTRNDNQEMEIRPIKRAKDDLLISSAVYNSTYVTIQLSNDIILNINTPPFKSFFINRILEGMKTKDREKFQKGEINESQIIEYKVDTDEHGDIRSITVSNYRERERLNEIFNTATWVLTRMLEKGN